MKTFTKNPIPVILFILLLLIAAVACKKEKTTDLSDTFTLTQSAPYSFKEGDKTLATVSLITVEDSRCPVNANCTSPGFGLVTLKIKGLGINGEKTIKLYLSPNVPKTQKDLQEISLNGTKYILQLRQINPYPSINMPQTPTNVMLSLIKI